MKAAMNLCGDGRLARPSGAKLPPLCPTTNLAKFLHLQVLMWPDLLENYTTSRPPRGAGDGWLFRLRMGFLWAGAAVRRSRSRRAILMASAAEGPADYALRNVSSVISGGTPIRTGKPNVPSPRFT